MRVSVSRFTCKRDEFAIRGRQYIPAAPKPPVIIISHEFLTGSFTTRRYARCFSKMGYAVFCYDFVGGTAYGGSGGKHTDMTVSSELKDLHAVINYAKGLRETEGSPVYLMGCSQGGLVSALAAAELGDDISGLILFYPALSIPDDARAGCMIFNTKFDANSIPETIKCGPFTFSGSYAAEMLEMDVYKEISAYKGPVFIAHGDADGIVDISYSKKAQAAYIKQRCSLMTLPRARHIFAPLRDKPARCGAAHFLEGRREILTIDVSLTKIIPELKGINSRLTIPFTGSAGGDFFKGSILPGACDVQQRKGFKTVSLCARYTIEGTDYTGAKCRIEIENLDMGSGWKPTVHTDSEALAFLNSADCFALVKQRGLKGPLVRIFA